MEPKMSLKEQLATLRTQSAAKIPPEKVAIMHRATEDLRRSGIMDRVLRVGASAPAFALANHDGRRVSSTELLARGPMILSFFRGSW
jgi:hypothetical protein